MTNLKPIYANEILDYILEDDSTSEWGGTAFIGETVRDFLEDYTEEPEQLTVNALNTLLEECGIKKIVLDNYV